MPMTGRPSMRFAVSVPNFAEYADPRTVADLASVAERAGWDGFFVWDHLVIDRGWVLDVGDPWIILAAVAAATERIRLGPTVTPLPRRRPWHLAREAVSLDQLSGGRLVLGVGIGSPPEAEFGTFGEPEDLRTRAEMLDEGLTILDGMWTGEPFAFEGRHYRVKEASFRPRPVQRPRIPIWVATTWPREGPLRRAARWDGAAPMKLLDGELAFLDPDDVRALCATIESTRGTLDGFDILVGGETPGDPAAGASLVEPFALAGATWWAESVNPRRGPLEDMRDRIGQGPPRV
jgi:Luciferase-like monooxygenase